MASHDDTPKRMSGHEAEARRSELGADWQLNSAGHLERSFSFPNFMGALTFANTIGAEAEAAGHHPDLYIAWGTCRVEIWTHDIDGLSERDFTLAATIGDRYAPA